MINFYQYSKRQRNVRFKKIVNLTATHTSKDHREIGFVILGRMLSDLGGNFDGITPKNIGILSDLCISNFRMAGKEQRIDFITLHTKIRVFYGKEENGGVQSLYGMTRNPIINDTVLDLWKGIVNWSRREIGNPYVAGIYAPEVVPKEATFFIFSGMDLENTQFFALGDRGIDFPTPDARANFRKNCLIQTEMHGAIINHVDFSKSLLARINREKEDQADYKMSCIGTVFDEANLINCNFGRADLKDASFVRSNITGSNFSRTKNLTKEQFQQGAYWIRPGRPQFPNNFPPSFADTLPKPPSLSAVIRGKG